MSKDATEVRVAGAGHVYIAPVGTPIPTTPGPLASPWVDLGLVKKDGAPTFSLGRETSPLQAWTALNDIRKLVTSAPKSVKFTLYQTNREVFSLAAGGGTFTTNEDGITSFTPPPDHFVAEHMLAIGFGDGDITALLGLTRCSLDSAVEIPLSDTDGLSYPVSLSALDATPPWFFVTDDPAFATP